MRPVNPNFHFNRITGIIILNLKENTRINLNILDCIELASHRRNQFMVYLRIERIGIMNHRVIW